MTGPRGLRREPGGRPEKPPKAAWPGVTPPGFTCDTPRTRDDFYPTILEMAVLGGGQSSGQRTLVSPP
jgi:hypothetical protein